MATQNRKLSPTGIELSQVRRAAEEFRATAMRLDTFVNPFGHDDVEALIKQLNACNAAVWALVMETKKRRFL